MDSRLGTTARKTNASEGEHTSAGGKSAGKRLLSTDEVETLDGAIFQDRAERANRALEAWKNVIQA